MAPIDRVSEIELHAYLISEKFEEECKDMYVRKKIKHHCDVLLHKKLERKLMLNLMKWQC